MYWNIFEKVGGLHTLILGSLKVLEYFRKSRRASRPDFRKFEYIGIF
jgi:hypothetical protein